MTPRHKLTRRIDVPKKISLRYLLQNLTNFSRESWSNLEESLCPVNLEKGFADSIRGLTSLSSMLCSAELTTSLCSPDAYHHEGVSARALRGSATSDHWAYSESDVGHSLAQRQAPIGFRMEVWGQSLEKSYLPNYAQYSFVLQIVWYQASQSLV